MRQSRIHVLHDLAVGAHIVLEGQRGHYLQHVLRVSPGQRLTVFNGQGGEYTGEVVELGRSRVGIILQDFVDIDRASPLEILLGLCITKRDAMDTAIQMATELGVTQIYPLLSVRTNQPQASLGKRQDHWQQIVFSACEQCGLNRPPLLQAATSLQSWLEDMQADLKLMADPVGQQNLLDLDARPHRIALLIGPEGGLTIEERLVAQQHDFLGISLGPRILRAAHAPATLVGLLQARFGDLKHPDA